jgi:hypothetical protein
MTSRRGSKLRFASFLGGSGEDGSFGAGGWLDDKGNWFVPGYTDSADFPTTPGAFQPHNAGELDVFLVKVDLYGKRHPERPSRDRPIKVIVDPGGSGAHL